MRGQFNICNGGNNIMKFNTKLLKKLLVLSATSVSIFQCLLCKGRWGLQAI